MVFYIGVPVVRTDGRSVGWSVARVGWVNLLSYEAPLKKNILLILFSQIEQFFVLRKVANSYLHKHFWTFQSPLAWSMQQLL